MSIDAIPDVEHSPHYIGVANLARIISKHRIFLKHIYMKENVKIITEIRFNKDIKL